MNQQHHRLKGVTPPRGPSKPPKWPFLHDYGAQHWRHYWRGSTATPLLRDSTESVAGSGGTSSHTIAAPTPTYAPTVNRPYLAKETDSDGNQDSFGKLALVDAALSIETMFAQTPCRKTPAKFGAGIAKWDNFDPKNKKSSGLHAPLILL